MRVITLVFTALLVAMIALTSTAADAPAGQARMSVKSSYTFDVCHFLNILSGDPKFTTYHLPEYREWNGKLSEQSKGILKAIIQARGTTVFSSALTLAISALPDFENRSLMDILRDPKGLVDAIYREMPDAEKTPPEQIYQMIGGLAVVVGELEAKGFRKYWDEKKLPAILKAIDKFNAFQSTLAVDMGTEADFVLGPIDGNPRKQGQATLYMLAFAEPYGTGLFGRRYTVPVTWDSVIVTRTALHEMLHQPGNLGFWGKAFDTILNDPFFINAFNSHMKINKVDYQSPQGFLEENIVEALETASSTRLGLCTDPAAYLRGHDGGDHLMSAVLVKYFLAIPKEPAETTAEYLSRVVAAMPMGKLDAPFKDFMGKR